MTKQRMALVVLSVVATIAIVLIVVGQLWLRGQAADDDRDTAISEAADRAVTTMLSYDYRRLEAGAAAAPEVLTGDAKAQYVEAQAPVAKTAVKLESVVTADVKALTVLDQDDDSARVLLFVNQLSSSTQLSEPQLDQSRVVITLTRSGSTWLVSTIAAV